MTRVAAVILAGGRGERLGGVNKALLEIDGVELVHRLAPALAGCSPILLSTGRGGFDIPPLKSVTDLPGNYGGPLAGVAAVVAALRPTPPDFLLSVAVDTPLFPADFLGRALAVADAAGVMATYAGQDYPTNALWPFQAIADLPEQVHAGTAPRSLRRLGDFLGMHRLDYGVLAASDPFRSINTPDDAAHFGARNQERPVG